MPGLVTAIHTGAQTPSVVAHAPLLAPADPISFGFESADSSRASAALVSVTTPRAAGHAKTRLRLEPADFEVQKSGPNAAGRALITSLQAGAVPAYAMALGGKLPTVPKSLVQFSELLLRTSLVDANAQFYSDDVHSVPQHLQKYMSGSNNEAFRFEDGTVHEFLASLFHHIQAEAAVTEVTLAGWDLYHGHFFSYVDEKNPSKGDLGILFHAKEHPTDFAVSPNQPDPREGSRCCSRDSDYHFRNYVWLMSTNQIVLLNPEHSTFPSGLVSPAQAAFFTVNEEAFMTTNLGSINYFPGMTAGPHTRGKDLLVAPMKAFPVDLQIKRCEESKLKALIEGLGTDALLELKEILRMHPDSKRLSRIPKDKRVAIKLLAESALLKRAEKRQVSMMGELSKLLAKKYPTDDAFNALMKTENNGVFSAFRAECVLGVMACGYDADTAAIALKMAHPSGTDVDLAIQWLESLES